MRLINDMYMLDHAYKGFIANTHRNNPEGEAREINEYSWVHLRGNHTPGSRCNSAVASP